MFIGTFINRNPFLLILSLSILSAFAGISSAETLVSGAISTDTTGNLADSPYVILEGGVTVANGITLTLDPGIVVKFESPNAKLRILGKLNASGTLDNKIIFTLIKDDSYGGVGYPITYAEVKV